MRPENGSAVVLNTKADAGPPPLIFWVISLPPAVAGIPSRSVGAGRFSTMKLSIRSAPILCRPEAQKTGKMRISAHTLLESGQNLLDFERPFVEKLLHQGIIALGHHLDERFVRFLGGVRQIGGDIALFALAVTIGSVGIGFHADQVDHALELALGADGDLDGNGGAAEILLDVGEGALEIGAFAVELIDDDGAGELEIVGEAPDLFGLHFDAGHAVHQDQGRIGGHQRSAGIINKDVVAGGVEDIDFGLLPLGHGDGGGNSDFAGDFLVIKIGDGIAFIDAEKAIGCSGR